LVRRLLLALVAAFILASPAPAADDPQLARIPTMALGELDALITTVVALVSKDTLALRSSGEARDCLELNRAANSFALGYSYLAAVRDTLGQRTENEARLLRTKAVQARVVTFAARARAEEWLRQSCRGYQVPADQAADPRYQTPARISDPEYTEALIEGRQAAETNLAIAVATGISGKCPESVTAAQNITLLVPYLDRLVNDTARRPQVLGPRASRLGLQTSRRQLLAALSKLRDQYARTCAPADPVPEQAP